MEDEDEIIKKECRYCNDYFEESKKIKSSICNQCVLEMRKYGENIKNEKQL